MVGREKSRMGEEVRIEREVGFGVRLTRENEGLVQGKPQGWGH